MQTRNIKNDIEEYKETKIQRKIKENAADEHATATLYHKK